MMRKHGLTMLMWSLAVSAVAAQDAKVPTLAESALLHRTTQQGPLYIERINDHIVLPLRDMVQRSDLILQALVRPRRTYLSDNQSWLYTEFEATPIRILAQPRPRVPQQQPGPSPILIEQSGGSAVFNGVEVIVRDSEFHLLPTGEPLVLFLTYDEKNDRYRLLGSASAFAVRASRIVPLLKSHVVEAEFGGIPYDQFIRDIQENVQATGLKR